MKRSIKCAVTVFMLAVLASCQPAVLPAGTAVGNSGSPAAAQYASPAPASPTPAATIPYINLGFPVPYEPIEPVNAGKAKEIKIALPEGMENPAVYAWPDGSCLAIGEKIEYEESGFAQKTVSAKIMAAQYGAKGEMLWSRVYDDLEDGYAGQVKTMPDGGYVLAYSALVKYENGQYSPSTQYLVFCDGGGNVLKQHHYGQIGIFEYLCVTDAGEVYAVGEASFKDGKPVDSPNQADADPDVSILKFDAAGNPLFAKKIGGSDFDSPTGAFWAKNLGLVIAIRTQAADGDLKAPEGVALDEHNHAVLLAALDGDGNIRWQYWEDNRNNLYYGELVPSGDGALVCGYRGGRTFIMRLDKNGKKLWEIAPDEGEYSVIALAAFPDGRFALAVNRYQEDDKNRGVYLALYDPNGAMRKKIKLPPNEIPRSIQPTDDGGLAAVGTQNIKTLPQPAYLSSIWCDTETIVTKYDKDLNIQWRKVYDKYKDSTRRDIAVPLADGRVIVEN
jgi:hypothetical protein